MLKAFTFAMIAAAATAVKSSNAQPKPNKVRRRAVKKGGSSSDDSGDYKVKKFVDVAVTNLSFQQPFGRFFAVVHDGTVDPMFQFGHPASPELADLAENGDPSKLVEMYDGQDGDIQASVVTEVAVFGGEKATFKVLYYDEHPYITIGSMCLNTNDW